MLLHDVISRIFGTPNRFKRAAPNGRKIKSSERRTTTKECQRTQGILGDVVILLQVLAKHVNGSGTTVSPAEAICEMEVVSCGRRGISFCQGTSDVVTATGVLRPTARPSHGV